MEAVIANSRCDITHLCNCGNFLEESTIVSAARCDQICDFSSRRTNFHESGEASDCRFTRWGEFGLCGEPATVSPFDVRHANSSHCGVSRRPKRDDALFLSG